MVDQAKPLTLEPADICDETINVRFTGFCATTVTPADVAEREISDATFVITVDR